MPDYTARFGFQGHADKDVAWVNYSLGTLPDEAAAIAAVTAILTPLSLITLADIEVSLKSVIQSFDASPAFGVDAHDEALLITHLNDVGTKLYPSLRIPAPSSDIVMPDGMAIDVTDANLIAFVAAVAANVVLSDGESIDTTTANGIKGGKVRSRPKTYKV